jgi:hypothetical protein
MTRRALLVAVILLALLVPPREAKARPFVAPDGKVMVGVLGGRTVGGYERAAGKRPAVFQFFVAWGDRFRYAYRRAADAGAGLSIHMSTYNGPGTEERTTPRAIALGREDAYLYSLGDDFARHRKPVYLRLFSEMNNAANPYSVYSASGRHRGAAHTHYWFRQSWRRVEIILKGGRVTALNRRLRRIGLPKLRDLERPRGIRVRLARPHVALQWVPMTAGSPDIPGNRPSAYWPGAAYVDWVGTDFYSRFPNFAGLNRFYNARLYAGKPFVFGEWAMWGADDPRFMRRFFSWVHAHPRVKMLLYNQGNAPTSEFRLFRYPRAARVMRRALRAERYTSRVARASARAVRRGATRPKPRHRAPAVRIAVASTHAQIPGLGDLVRVRENVLAAIGTGPAGAA